MTRTVTVYRSDAVDEIMALTGGQTAAFPLPKVAGGAHIRVYDSAAKGTEYICESAGTAGDFVIRREEADHTKVRIAATAHGQLACAERVYVQTAGNIYQVEATEEIYEEEESEDA